MAYTALYRRWRPQNFDTLVGQDHISITLKNAILANRIAHAYLFSGPRGTGKTSTAKILAKALNCEHGPTVNPCGKCPVCERITNGSSMDVLEIDAASNRGIDEIRELRESVKFSSVEGRYKVYIIDEVHMLTTEAFNALLKTLEEPPSHVVFILATTEAHKIPATILSRCQRYDFHRIEIGEIVSRLKEVLTQAQVDYEEEALRLVARQADGGMRDALSILDQCLASADGKIQKTDVIRVLGVVGDEWLSQMAETLLSGKVSDSLLLIEKLSKLGKDIRQVMLEFIQYLRNVLLVKAIPGASLNDIYISNQEALQNQAAQFSEEQLMVVIETLSRAVSEMRNSTQPRIAADVAFISIHSRMQNSGAAFLVERIAKLEQMLAAGAVLQPDKSHKARTSAETPAATVSAKVAEAVAAKPPTTAKSINPASANILQIWKQILETLKSSKRTVHALVSQGKLVEISQETVTISFEPGYAFAKERVEKSFSADVEKAVEQVVGSHKRIQCCIVGEEPGVKNAAESVVSRPEDNPLVKSALEVFGGTIIEVQTEDES